MEGRDAKGRLIKGHPYIKPPPGVKNGRKKTISGKVRDTLKIVEDAMPQLFLDMIADAQNPKNSVHDRQQCRECLIDRIYGKPRQGLDVKSRDVLEILVRWDGNRDRDETSRAPAPAPS